MKPTVYMKMSLKQHFRLRERNLFFNLNNELENAAH